MPQKLRIYLKHKYFQNSRKIGVNLRTTIYTNRSIGTRSMRVPGSSLIEFVFEIFSRLICSSGYFKYSYRAMK